MAENEEILETPEISTTFTQETVILINSEIQKEAEEKGEVNLLVLPLQKFNPSEYPAKQFSFIITVAGAAAVDTKLTATLRHVADLSSEDKQEVTVETSLKTDADNLNPSPLKEEVAQTIFTYTPERSDTSVINELKTFLPTHETIQEDVIRTADLEEDESKAETITDDQKIPEDALKEDESETSEHFISAPESTDDEAEKESDAVQETTGGDQDANAYDMKGPGEDKTSVKGDDIDQQIDADLSANQTESLTTESRTEEKTEDKDEEKDHQEDKQITEEISSESSVQSAKKEDKPHVEEDQEFVENVLTDTSSEFTGQKSVENNLQVEEDVIKESSVESADKSGEKDEEKNRQVEEDFIKDASVESTGQTSGEKDEKGELQVEEDIIKESLTGPSVESTGQKEEGMEVQEVDAEKEVDIEEQKEKQPVEELFPFSDGSDLADQPSMDADIQDYKEKIEDAGIENLPEIFDQEIAEKEDETDVQIDEQTFDVNAVQLSSDAITEQKSIPQEDTSYNKPAVALSYPEVGQEAGEEIRKIFSDQGEVPPKTQEEPVVSVTLTGTDFTVVDIRTVAASNSNNILMAWAGGDLSIVDVNITKNSKSTTELKIESWTPALPPPDTETSKIPKEYSEVKDSGYQEFPYIDEEPFRPTVFNENEGADAYGPVEKEVQTDIVLGTLLTSDSIASMEAENVTGDTLDVPEDTLDVLEDTLDVPEDTLDVPEDTLDVPEDTLGVPEDTLGVPEDTLDVPEDTLDVPEDTLGVPEDTLDVPEDTLGVPEDPSPTYNSVSGHEMNNLKTASQIFEEMLNLEREFQDPTKWGPGLMDKMLNEVPWKEEYFFFEDVASCPMWDKDLLIQPNEMEGEYVQDIEIKKSVTLSSGLNVPSLLSEELEGDGENLGAADENADARDYYLPMGPAISQLSTLTGILIKKSPALINISIDPQTWGFPAATDERYGVTKDDFFAATSEIIPFDMLPRFQSYLALEDDGISTVFNPGTKPLPGGTQAPKSSEDLPVFFIIKIDADSGETRIRIATGKSTEKENNFVVQYEDCIDMNELEISKFSQALQFCSAQMKGARNENLETELVLQSPKDLNMKKSLALRFDNSSTTGDETFPVFRSGLLNRLQMPDYIPANAVITNLNFHFEPSKNEFISSQTFIIESSKKGLRTTLLFSFKTKTLNNTFTNPINTGKVTHFFTCNAIKSSEETNTIGPNECPIISVPLGTTGKGLLKLCTDPAPINLINNKFANLSFRDIGTVQEGDIIYKVFADGEVKTEIRALQPGDPPVTIRIPLRRDSTKNVPPSQFEALDLGAREKLEEKELLPFVDILEKDIIEEPDVERPIDGGGEIDVTLEVWRNGIKEYEGGLEIKSVNVPLCDNANYKASLSLYVGPCLAKEDVAMEVFAINMLSQPTIIDICNMRVTLEVISGEINKSEMTSGYQPKDKTIVCESDICPAHFWKKSVIEYSVLKDDKLVNEALKEIDTDDSPFIITIPLESEDAESFVKNIIEGKIEVQITCEVTINGKLQSDISPCLKSPFIFDIPFEDDTDAQIKLQIRPMQKDYMSDLSPTTELKSLILKTEAKPVSAAIPLSNANYPSPVSMFVPLINEGEKLKPLSKPPERFSNLNPKWLENLPRMEGDQTAVGIPCATVVKDSSECEENLNEISQVTQLESIQKTEDKTYEENETRNEIDCICIICECKDTLDYNILTESENVQNINPHDKTFETKLPIEPENTRNFDLVLQNNTESTEATSPVQMVKELSIENMKPKHSLQDEKESLGLNLGIRVALVPLVNNTCQCCKCRGIYANVEIDMIDNKVEHDQRSDEDIFISKHGVEDTTISTKDNRDATNQSDAVETNFNVECTIDNPNYDSSGIEPPPEHPDNCICSRCSCEIGNENKHGQVGEEEMVEEPECEKTTVNVVREDVSTVEPAGLTDSEMKQDKGDFVEFSMDKLESEIKKVAPSIVPKTITLIEPDVMQPINCVCSDCSCHPLGSAKEDQDDVAYNQEAETDKDALNSSAEVTITAYATVDTTVMVPDNCICSVCSCNSVKPATDAVKSDIADDAEMATEPEKETLQINIFIEDKTNIEPSTKQDNADHTDVPKDSADNETVTTNVQISLIPDDCKCQTCKCESEEPANILKIPDESGQAQIMKTIAKNTTDTSTVAGVELDNSANTVNIQTINEGERKVMLKEVDTVVSKHPDSCKLPCCSCNEHSNVENVALPLTDTETPNYDTQPNILDKENPVTGGLPSQLYPLEEPRRDTKASPSHPENCPCDSCTCHSLEAPEPELTNVTVIPEVKSETLPNPKIDTQKNERKFKDFLFPVEHSDVSEFPIQESKPIDSSKANICICCQCKSLADISQREQVPSQEITRIEIGEQKDEATPMVDKYSSHQKYQENTEKTTDLNPTSNDVSVPTKRLCANVEYTYPVDEGEISTSKVLEAGKSPMKVEIPVGIDGCFGTLVISTALYGDNLVSEESSNLPQENTIFNPNEKQAEEEVEEEKMTVQYCTEIHTDDTRYKSLNSQNRCGINDVRPDIQRTPLSEKSHISSSLDIIENIRKVCEKEIGPLFRKLNDLGCRIHNLNSSGAPKTSGILLDTRFDSTPVYERINSLSPIRHPFQFNQHGIHVIPNNSSKQKYPNSFPYSFSCEKCLNVRYSRAGQPYKGTCLNIKKEMDTDTIECKESMELNRTSYEQYNDDSKLELRERNFTGNTENYNENCPRIGNTKKTEHIKMRKFPREKNKYERNRSDITTPRRKGSREQTEFKHMPLPVTSDIYPTPVAMFIPFHDDIEDIEEDNVNIEWWNAKSSKTQPNTCCERSRNYPRPQTYPLMSQCARQYDNLNRMSLPPMDFNENMPTSHYPYLSTCPTYSQNRHWGLCNEGFYGDLLGTLASNQLYLGGGVIKPTPSGMVVHSNPHDLYYRRNNFGFTSHRHGTYDRDSPRYDTGTASSQKRRYYY